MTSKRKSVTFREKVSMIYPKDLNGSSAPAPLTTTPATKAQPLTLDPMYLTWLRSATRVHYPFIVNETFATHVYLQNFDEHIRSKNDKEFHRAQSRMAAVPALAEKFGSLGWGTLYREVNEKAWVKNYREIYRFDGSDEHLLEKIAEAYDEIKRTIAEEQNVYANFTQDGSIYSPLSAQKWESFTQGVGALISPNLGPGGVKVTFDNATDIPLDEEEPAQFSAGNQEGNRNGMSFDMGFPGRNFGGAMLDAGTEMQMLSAGF